MNGTKLEGKIGRIDHTDLKATCWDIVVKKECDMRWLEYCIRENKTVEEYNNGLPEYYEKLTEEEFNILKEGLEYE